MEITATHLRKDLFQVMEQAKLGEEVFITHKGSTFQLVPEKQISKLDRVTPMAGFDPDVTDGDWERGKLEMQAEWEAKWETRSRL